MIDRRRRQTKTEARESEGQNGEGWREGDVMHICSFPGKGEKKKSGFPPSNYPPDGISNEEGEKVTDCLSEEYLFKQQ